MTLRIDPRVIDDTKQMLFSNVSGNASNENLKKYRIIVNLAVTYGIINTQDESGRTTLMQAAYNTKYGTAFAKILIKAGADLSIKDLRGQTVLHHAVLAQNFRLVEKLLKKEIDIDAKDYEGNTALMLSNHTYITRPLLNKNADIFLRNNKDESFIKLRFKNADYNNAPFQKEILKTIFLKLSRLNESDKRILEHFLIESIKQYPYLALTALLLKANIHPDARDADNNTALMWAARNGMIQQVEQLIEYKADVNAKNNSNDTALILILKAGDYYTCTDIVKILLKHKADPTLCNNENESPLALAKPQCRILIHEAIEQRKTPGWFTEYCKSGVLPQSQETPTSMVRSSSFSSQDHSFDNKNIGPTVTKDHSCLNFFQRLTFKARSSNKPEEKLLKKEKISSPSSKLF